MKPFRTVSGIALPLDRVDVDTDQIIPKQFLKRIERTGYGDFLFCDWRNRSDGTPDPTFVLNRAEYQGAPILLAGRNFGCGSSREHAAWALSDFGIRAVVAPSFADIFQSNCFQNGLLPVILADAEVRTLMSRALQTPGHEVTVDLESCRVTDKKGFEASFEVDPFRRECLLKGLDDIDLTLRNVDRIRAYEEARGAAG
ncbi:MAG: 3-isopropylmalate dehydratase small subunit [Gemmatimonadetes bacterium]|nr:3-isopropylmalate dehydratase small subunit [Gemmatimonadota bacterium]